MWPAQEPSPQLLIYIYNTYTKIYKQIYRTSI